MFDKESNKKSETPDMGSMSVGQQQTVDMIKTNPSPLEHGFSQYTYCIYVFSHSSFSPLGRHATSWPTVHRMDGMGPKRRASERATQAPSGNNNAPDCKMTNMVQV